jgi:hypothetical protein
MLWRNNGLSIVLIVLFLASFFGQAWSGWLEHNAETLEHGSSAIGFGAYLLSGHFWEATGENWESEFLQMAAFVLLTAFLYQKGSAESKRIGAVEEVDLDPRRFADHPDVPWPVKRGGWVLTLYENSLGVAFTLLFLISIAMHAVGGLAEFNNEQVSHGEQAVTLARYVASSRFWFESFQNWQSEFLSLAAMVMGTVYLRQRYSGESKPVFAPHEETGKS